MWNSIEFASYLLFLSALYNKIQMHLLQSQIRDEYQSLQETAAADASLGSMTKLDQYRDLQYWYLGTLAVNASFMWIKLFKYIDVIPQLGMLVSVLSAAMGPVLIFSAVALIPCMGLALAYHVQFGTSLLNCSSVGMSLNTLMRMALGDFDFQEIFIESPLSAILLFWLSSVLLAFVLTNIFVAIILNAYDAISATNPDTNDSSQFFSMVKMVVNETVRGVLSKKHRRKDGAKESSPHVLQNKMDRIEDETYW